MRLLHTVRHLKPKQIYYRYINSRRKKRYARNSEKYRKVFEQEADRLGLERAVLCVSGGAEPGWLVRDHSEQGMYRTEDLLENRFRFLHREKELDPLNIWKRHEDMPLLWDFNLHYFEYVMLLDREGHQEKAVELIQDWIEKNPFWSEPAWHQFTVSFRLRYWAKFFMNNPDLLTGDIVRSMALQTVYLSRNPEFHLCANHLLENMITLMFTGLMFGNTMLISTYEPLLMQELKEQTNSAGGHYEGSFMYHLLILEGLADLHLMYRAAGRKCMYLTTSIKKWSGYLCRVLSRQGVFPLFGDAAQGIAAGPAELHAYIAGNMDIPEMSPDNRVIDAHGLLIAEYENTYVAMNAQEPAPPYNPGHVHSDLCTFELYCGSKPVIIDSGVFGYAETEQRVRERGTYAHNTVLADGLEIHDVWGSFRMGRRSSVASAETDTIRNRIKAAYRNRDISVTREICVKSDRVEIADTIRGMRIEFETRFHFPAEYRLQNRENGKFILSGSDLSIEISIPPDLKTVKELFFYSREFGKQETGTCLIVKGNTPQQKYMVEIKEDR